MYPPKRSDKTELEILVIFESFPVCPPFSLPVLQDESLTDALYRRISPLHLLIYGGYPGGKRPVPSYPPPPFTVFCDIPTARTAVPKTLAFFSTWEQCLIMHACGTLYNSRPPYFRVSKLLKESPVES